MALCYIRSPLAPVGTGALRSELKAVNSCFTALAARLVKKLYQLFGAYCLAIKGEGS